MHYANNMSNHILLFVNNNSFVDFVLDFLDYVYNRRMNDEKEFDCTGNILSKHGSPIKIKTLSIKIMLQKVKEPNLP